jgi:hypothetical protein
MNIQNKWRMLFLLLNMALPFALQAQNLKIENKYGSPINLTVLDKDGKQIGAVRRLDSPLASTIGKLAAIGSIEIEPTKTVYKLTQSGKQYVDLHTARQLSQQNPERDITIAVQGGWVTPWVYETRVAEEGHASQMQGLTMEALFPTAVRAAQTGAPVLARYIFGFNKETKPTPEQIKTIYKELSRNYHPDKAGTDPFFKEVIQLVNLANEAIKNPAPAPEGGPNAVLTLPTDWFKVTPQSPRGEKELEESFVHINV